MRKNQSPLPPANQYPEKTNYLSRLGRRLLSSAPCLKIIPAPSRPQGISFFMRVKDEADWIRGSILSILGVADEVVIVDHGSTDGSYEILKELAESNKGIIRLWQRPDLDICALCDFVLGKTSFRWVFKWDGDMIAHTSGQTAISKLRDRLFALDSRKYYLIYLRHINLAGDLMHQDADEMVHIEEYIHTFSDGARFIHPGRFEAVKYPKYYQPLFWYEPYAFHVNVKPARRMLVSRFYCEWLEKKMFQYFPRIEDYVRQRIETEFGTNNMDEAQRLNLLQACESYIPYNLDMFGPYPELLQPHVDSPRYRLRYKSGKITGRDE